MTDAPIVCRRCGFRNVAGDQFCGSCGAFLEWEGQEAGGEAGIIGSADTGEPSDAAEAADAGEPPGPGEPPGTGEPESWAGRFFPTPPPVDDHPEPAPLTIEPPVAPTPGPLAAGLVRCTTCGIANAAGRTFCQTCGATLPAGETIDIEATRAAWLAKGGANAEPAVPKPGASSGAAPGTPRSAPKAPAAEAKGGFPTWIVWVALLGIAVGVAVVVFTQLDLGPDASSGATAAPTVPATPTAPAASPSPAASAPSAFSGAPAHRPGISAAHAGAELAYFAPMSRRHASAPVSAVAARTATSRVTRA